MDTSMDDKDQTTEQQQSLLQELFDCLDYDDNGLLDFKEVVGMLKQLDPAHSMRSARNAAVEALLLCDMDADRVLTPAEFQLLLKRLFAVADISFEEGTNKILAAIQQRQQQQQQQQVDSNGTAPADAASHLGTAAAAAAAPTTGGASPQQQQQQQQQDQQPQQQGHRRSPSAAYVHATKLKALFRLWDLDGDGFVSFQELCIGLAKFKPIRHKQDITSTFSEAARAIKQHDDVGDHQLCDAEFEAYITNFMAQAGYGFDEVVDHLIVVASKQECDARLQRALDKSSTTIQHLLQAS